jgi:hypothetical protein
MLHKLARRALPAVAVAALAGLAVGAYARYAARSSSRSHKPTFTLAASPASTAITAGSTARYRLALRRRHFPWAVRFEIARPLPKGVLVSFKPRRTRGRGSTLTISTRTWTVPHVYRLVLVARHGRLKRRLTLTLRVTSATARTPRLEIAGNASAPLQPGVPEPIDLQITNTNPATVSVTGVTASLQTVRAPHATAALPCTLADFVLRQYQGPLPLSIPASATRSLAQLGIDAALWPHVTIVDRATNQDGCQDATVTFAFGGT